MDNYIIFPNVYPVACHTKNIGPGSTFVAIQGKEKNGNNYILEAIKKGAKKIIIEKNSIINVSVLEFIKTSSAELIFVENGREALADFSAEALGFPAKDLKIIAITGTKGKSTTAFLLNHILTHSGYRTALLTTVENKILDQSFSRSLTTEQPDYLNIFFDLCKKAKIDYVVMETAAQAFSLHRLKGLKFEYGIFTNFSQEHAEFYPNQNEYLKAKKKIIDHIKVRPKGKLFAAYSLLPILKDCQKLINIKTFDTKTDADISCQILENNSSGLTFKIKNIIMKAPAMIGEFNVFNILAALAVSFELKINKTVIKEALANFRGVPGRLNFKNLPNGALAVIDYAHNPSSFDAVLSALKALQKNIDNSKLIVVFGAGGERDPVKRPVMGSIAETYADQIILTSDNPRSEDLNIIIQDIMQGISKDISKNKIIIETDREIAIKKAYNLSNANTIIAILGKGPDEYQIVTGIKTYFSEKEILNSL